MSAKLEQPADPIQQPEPPLLNDVNAARAAFRAALVQVGLLLRFERDVQQLGVQGFAARAPNSIQRQLRDSIANYEQICNTMEAQLMAARAVVLADLAKVDPRYRPAYSKDDELQDVHVENNKLPAEQSDKGISGSPAVVIKKEIVDLTTSPAAMTAASIKGDDDMEDLFGPGTSGAPSSIATPANVPFTVSTDNTTSMYANVNAQSESQQHQQNTLPSESNSFNATDLLSSFGEPTSAADGGGLDPAMDFSSMSAEDFGALLATLGPSGDDGGMSFNIDGTLSYGNLGNMDFGNPSDML